MRILADLQEYSRCLVQSFEETRVEPMTCSSEKRFFTSNLRLVGDWTPNRPATQKRGDVAPPKGADFQLATALLFCL